MKRYLCGANFEPQISYLEVVFPQFSAHFCFFDFETQCGTVWGKLQVISVYFWGKLKVIAPNLKGVFTIAAPNFKRVLHELAPKFKRVL